MARARKHAQTGQKSGRGNALEAAGQEERHGQRDGQRDEADNEAVQRALLVGEGGAGVILEAVWEVGRHGRVRENARQVAAVAHHVAAGAHAGAVQQHAHLSAAVDTLRGAEWLVHACQHAQPGRYSRNRP